MSHKRFTPFCLFTLLAPCFGFASDDIQGSVATVLEAIKGKSVGRIYAFDAQIAVPPTANESRFVVRDKTGSVVIRRDFDWPTESFREGDSVRLRCEIGATASIPASAFFRSMVLVARDKKPKAEYGNWLIATDLNESARVTRLPIWLTATKVCLALGGLVVLVFVILLWNTLLRRMIDRRSRELTDERLASFSNILKVEERTRLAVELHDTIAQMLTGVSLEIDAARDFARSDVREMNRHLNLATRTLASCRNDLRNCMWDLRNQTLDDVKLDNAICRTLAPHLSGVSLAVRFSVDRELFTDTTVLAILRIIRELALNAVRHGSATAIKVAGCIEDGHLLFSVADNGCGFDPDHAPGADQGHFGLQGVTERVERLNGELTIKSTRGEGTKVIVSIALPKQQNITS